MSAVGLLAIACADLGRPTESMIGPGASMEARARAGGGYTPEQLHQANPADWVGRAHNLILAAAIAEWQKPDVSIRDLCGRLAEQLADTALFGRAADHFPRGWQRRLPEAFGNSTLCRKRSRTRLASASASMGALTTDFSSAAYELFDDIQLAVEESGTPTELASALSPILTASYSLDSLDAGGVQAVLAVAQSSFEFWYADNYAQVIAVQEETANDFLDGCESGAMEDEQYEYNGQTYQCQGMQWRLTNFAPPSGTRTPSLVLVSTGRNVLLAACPSPEETAKQVILGDVIGGVSGAVLGISGGPAGILVFSVAGSAVSSTGVSFFAAVVSFFCSLF